MSNFYSRGNDQIGKGRIYFVGTYIPRQCGIATFTHDLAHAIGEEIGSAACQVVALNNRPEGYDYPPEVVFEISQNQIHDYRLAAEYINLSGEGIVCLQHEFGIFGGPQGTYITHFLKNLKKPVLTTLHTVLKEPTPEYHQALIEIAQLSQGLVVMSRHAIDILREVYGIPDSKIFFIHHGVPDVPFIDPNYYKDEFNVEGRLVLLTFGLLNPNKGIENVLEALPEIVAKYPKVAYIILGATHPEIRKVHGESYRLSLQRKVARLGLEQHVFFHNRFVSLAELCQFIGACDIYITPYLSREQIVSGTLAYALGMGKAVISTPYWYAEEMLQEGRGKLVDFGDIKGLQQAIIDLIENEIERHQMRKKAYEFGRSMTWKNVAREYIKALGEIRGPYQLRLESTSLKGRFIPQDTIPEIKLDHLFRLTDETGIIQHSIYGIPDRQHGYSTDDIARALVVVLMAYDQIKDENFLKLANIYMAFLRHAQLANGRFHNFMSYSRQFTDEEGSEDTQGRSIWGLGCAVHLGPTEWFKILGRELLERAIGNLKLAHPMAKAYTILGLYHYLQKYKGATVVKRLLQEMADSLIDHYQKSTKPGWRWFSDSVTYGNAKIPQALLLAYKLLGNEIYKTVSLEALNFLTAATYNGEFFDFIGNAHWYEKGNGRSFFDQQPIDAGYAVEAYILAYEITTDPTFLELGQAAFEWFLGRNRLGVSLYDFATGACYDGLTPQGPNLNQGAEPTIAFLLAILTMSQQQVLKTLVPREEIKSKWEMDYREVNNIVGAPVSPAVNK